MTAIDQHTKISTLIRANADSIEAIASLAKPLQKLKNPLLRRIMASRVTIAEVASIGGCSIDDFKRVLEPLGFVFTKERDASQAAAAVRPAWLSESITYTTLDVRKAIEDGHDPLKEINQSYRQLSPGDILCIINTFIPYPLIKLLENKGAQTFVDSINEQEYHTYFQKGGQTVASKPKSPSKISTLNPSEFQDILDSYDNNDVIRLDVRELPMPQPMEAILNALPLLRSENILHINHKRVPLHLLEEMEEYNYIVHLCEIIEGDVRLLIYRK